MRSRLLLALPLCVALLGLGVASLPAAPSHPLVAQGKPPKEQKPASKPNMPPPKQAKCYQDCSDPVMKCINGCNKEDERCMQGCQKRMESCTEKCGKLPDMGDSDDL